MLMYDKICMTDIITLINTQSHNSCKFNIPTVHFTCTVIQYTSHVRLSISTVHFTCKVVHVHIACTVIIYHIYKHIISIRVSVTIRVRTFACRIRYVVCRQRSQLSYEGNIVSINSQPISKQIFQPQMTVLPLVYLLFNYLF